MRVTELSICYIWPYQRIAVWEWKAKFLTRYPFLIFRSYETEFFETILYVPKWGVVSCSSPFSPSYIPWKTTQLAPSAGKRVRNRQFSEGIDVLGSRIFLWRYWFQRTKKMCFQHDMHFSFLISMKFKLQIVLKNDGRCCASCLTTGYYLRKFQVIFMRSDLFIAK